MIIFEHLNKFLSLFEECKKYDSIVQFCEQIEINNITCLFYEKGEKLRNPIDEKKLLEMFIELNKINMASKMTIFYIDIVFQDGRYKVYPNTIYEKQINRGECVLAKEIIKIFKKYNLNFTNKIREVVMSIREKEFDIQYEKGTYYLAEGNLNKKLKALI